MASDLSLLADFGITEDPVQHKATRNGSDCRGCCAFVGLLGCWAVCAVAFRVSRLGLRVWLASWLCMGCWAVLRCWGVELTGGVGVGGTFFFFFWGGG